MFLFFVYVFVFFVVTAGHTYKWKNKLRKARRMTYGIRMVAEDLIKMGSKAESMCTKRMSGERYMIVNVYS